MDRQVRFSFDYIATAWAQFGDGFVPIHAAIVDRAARRFGSDAEPGGVDYFVVDHGPVAIGVRVELQDTGEVLVAAIDPVPIIDIDPDEF